MIFKYKFEQQRQNNENAHFVNLKNFVEKDDWEWW